MYWTDWQRRRLERIRIADTLTDELPQREVILDQLSDLMGIRAISMSVEGGTTLDNINNTNACSERNGGCSHLCLITPYTRAATCSCAMGMELLPDNKTCIVPEAYLLFSQQKVCLLSLSLPLSLSPSLHIYTCVCICLSSCIDRLLSA